MKRAIAVIVTLAVIGGGAYFGKNYLARQPIEAGTPMKLILMQQVEAGKDQEGSEIPFIVAEDVRTAKGGIAIAKGSVAKGVIKESRGENMLSGLTNRPARLSIAFVEVKTVDGQTLRISSDREGKPEEAHAFNRANTGRQNISEKLEKISDDANVHATLRQIQDAFTTGKAPDFNDPKSKEALSKIAKELNLKDLANAVAQDRMGEVSEFLSSTHRAGGVVGSLASGNFTLGAVMELANVAGDVGSKLSQMIKGRSIRAFPGTEVTAFVVATTTVQTR